MANETLGYIKCVVSSQEGELHWSFLHFLLFNHTKRYSDKYLPLTLLISMSDRPLTIMCSVISSSLMLSGK